MLHPGPAKKVTIHLNEDTAAKRDFLYNEIFAFLFDHGVAGASLCAPTRVSDRTTGCIRLDLGPGLANTCRSESSSSSRRKRLPDSCPNLCDLLSDGLIEAHDTTIYKSDGAARSLPV